MLLRLTYNQVTSFRILSESFTNRLESERQEQRAKENL
jgi:hypothetical protein